MFSLLRRARNIRTGHTDLHILFIHVGKLQLLPVQAARFQAIVINNKISRGIQLPDDIPKLQFLHPAPIFLIVRNGSTQYLLGSRLKALAQASRQLYLLCPLTDHKGSRPGIDAQHQFENTVHRTCHGLLITLLLREIIRADDADDIPRHRVLHELQAHLQILPAVLTSFIPAHKAYTFPSLGIVCQQPFPMIADGIRRFFLRITNPLTHLVKELCHGQPLLCIVQYNAALLNRQDGIVRYIHLVGIQARGGQQPLILLEIPKGGLKILLLRNIDSRTNRLSGSPSASKIVQ